MDTAVRTPLAVFSLPQQLLVPLFQRPYVWDEENQWAPLWQDIRRLAEHQLSQPGTTASHFLGAVVLQASEIQAGSMPVWSLIDGQQRLTTLQLIFDAAAAAFEERGLAQLTGQLEALTHNAAAFAGNQVALKLRHSNRDRAAYDEVMDADPPIDYSALQHAGSLLARAHSFYATQVGEWIEEQGDDAIAHRATALTNVLTQSLQLVVISLRADEDSQEIFETLNARGTPLTAADLIKNLVFQRLAAEGVDTKTAYAEVWPFDTKFWEKELSVGRNLISRSSLFLNQWLVSRLGEEIGPKSTFARFKHFVEFEAGMSMAQLLSVIKQQADRYEIWTTRAEDGHANLDRVELNVYRCAAADVETLKPILLWLHGEEAAYSTETIHGVVALCESWIMRRILLRLPLGDLGRVVADLVKNHREVADEDLMGRVERYLARLNVASTYWPGDSELYSFLATEPAYRRYKRARLRMFLEAVEDHLRGYTGDKPSLTGFRVPRLGYPIEHVMPQKWKTNWPVADLEAEVRRDAHVHRIGNLTLVTASLNSSVSNGPWSGDKGKRAKLEQHDVLLMNRRIRDESVDGWDEERIDERSGDICAALIATWPVPEGHAPDINATTASSAPEVSIKELVAAGFIAVGTVLSARPGSWGPHECTVLPTGELLLDGKTYATPSGAGHVIRKGATNGWWFWEMPDGRRLKDVRAGYLATKSGDQ